jgi:hypothetical protein
MQGMDGDALYSIGDLARRTGLSATAATTRTQWPVWTSSAPAGRSMSPSLMSWPPGAELGPSPCSGQADDVSIPSCSQMAVSTWAAGPVASTATMTSLARNNSRTGRVFSW